MTTETRIWGEQAQVRRGNLALRRAVEAIGGCTGRILEAGCGAGRFIRTVKAIFPHLETHGADVSAEAIRRARTYDDGVTYAEGSLSHLPYPDAYFDAVLLFDVLEHVENPCQALNEIARVLRPGGLFHGLIPCEGQAGTLHWALWKLRFGGDLKLRHGQHIQRFRLRDVEQELPEHGIAITERSYSMHPAGQVKDILTYVAQEDWFRAVSGRPVVGPALRRAYRLTELGLWPAAYAESEALARVPVGAVVVHVTGHRVETTAPSTPVPASPDPS